MIKKFALHLLVVVYVVGCAVNPVTGQRELVLVSDQQAINIGTQQYAPAQQMQGGAYVTDPKLTAYVKSVGQKLARHSPAELPYEFVVLNNSVPNAWALPGGKIAINRGLLVELSNEGELAAVLAHEIVHAAARHGAKRMERGLLTQGLVVAAAIGGAGTEYGGDLVNLAQGGAALFNQKYSRDAEREADYYGTQMMAAAGYDPFAAVTLQETFVELSGGQQRAFLAGLLASHPTSQERVQNNRLLVKRLHQEGFNTGQFGQDAYAAAMRELREAQAAYDAYDIGATALAEEDLDSALAAVNDALAAYPQEALFHGLRGRVRMSQKRWADAVTNFDRAMVRDDAYFAYHLLRGMAHNELGQRAEAKADLDHSVRLLPTAQALHTLGAIAEADGNTAAAKRYYEQAARAGGTSGEAAATRLVTLEIDDQPAKYVTSRLRQGQDGRVWLDVQNLTHLELVDITVRVETRDANGVQTNNLSIARIPAKQTASLQFTPRAPLLDGQAYAVAASVE